MFYAPVNFTYSVHLTYYFQAHISSTLLYGHIYIHTVYIVRHINFSCFCFSSSHSPLFLLFMIMLFFVFHNVFHVFASEHAYYGFIYMHNKIWYNVCKQYRKEMKLLFILFVCANRYTLSPYLLVASVDAVT